MPSRTKKFRGGRTHGRGKKSGRGAGIIGGHGMAGYCKTGKIGMLKYNRSYRYGSRQGFKRPQCMVKADSTINVGELGEGLIRFENAGLARKEGDGYTVDLTGAGIDKLLGDGEIDVPVKVTVTKASAKAKEKIKAAGGSIGD